MIKRLRGDQPSLGEWCIERTPANMNLLEAYSKNAAKGRMPCRAMFVGWGIKMHVRRIARPHGVEHVDRDTVEQTGWWLQVAPQKTRPKTCRCWSYNVLSTGLFPLAFHGTCGILSCFHCTPISCLTNYAEWLLHGCLPCLYLRGIISKSFPTPST